MLGNYLQQTSSEDFIFQMHFFLALYGLTMTVVMEANRQLKRMAQADFCVLLDFSLTVKAAPHECVIWTSQP